MSDGWPFVGTPGASRFVWRPPGIEDRPGDGFMTRRTPPSSPSLLTPPSLAASNRSSRGRSHERIHDWLRPRPVDRLHRICVVRRIDGGAKSLFQVGHLERLPLNTPSPGVIQHARRLLHQEAFHGRTELVLDLTGVGRPVADRFRLEGVRPIKVTITAGSEELHDDKTGIYRVAKLVPYLDRPDAAPRWSPAHSKGPPRGSGIAHRTRRFQGDGNRFRSLDIWRACAANTTTLSSHWHSPAGVPTSVDQCISIRASSPGSAQLRRSYLGDPWGRWW